jgi:hypothetical protein
VGTGSVEALGWEGVGTGVSVGWGLGSLADGVGVGVATGWAVWDGRG